MSATTVDASHKTVTVAELNQFFTDIGSRMDASRPDIGIRELDQFFASISRQVTLAETRQRRINTRQATGFNVFDLIDPDENKLSDILAILLDPNGGHGQGDLFLRLLFEWLGFGSDSTLMRRARVLREAPTYGIQKYRRRIDVLVDAGVLLAIENKVDSLEQMDQVRDYLEHLRRCTEGHRQDSVLIYLSPDGRMPESLSPEMLQQRQADGSLHCWSYAEELRAWLEACRDGCKAQKIQDFLTDFIAYIRDQLKGEPVANAEEEDANES